LPASISGGVGECRRLKKSKRGGLAEITDNLGKQETANFCELVKKHGTGQGPKKRSVLVKNST